LKILIVGNGKHVKKRIANALLKLPDLNELLILDRNVKEKIIKNNITYINYEELLALDTKFHSIIVATPPSSHVEVLKKLSHLSEIFIIEKPLTTLKKDLNQENIFKLYKDKQIYDSLMYLFHPLWETASEIYNKEEINEVKATFTIPEIDQDDFRFESTKGGGFMFDMGIYPISLFFELSNNNFTIETLDINYSDSFNVDINGELKMKNSDNTQFHGKWGITGNYKNELLFRTADKEYCFPFIFSKPEDYLSYYEVKENGNLTKIEIGNFDQFFEMYKKYNNKLYKSNIYHKSKTKKLYNFIFELLDIK
tara:strand:+ start:1286 stop:2215 length:930 start_codon:yes stop_codon:yes gene_type:complete